MAARSTVQAGNWSDTATWSGGLVPGDGDTATINVGHNVTVDVNTTVGTGDTATDQLEAYAEVTVAQDVTLVIKGRAYTNQDFFVLAGATIHYDAATDGRWYQSQSGNPNAALKLQGTAAKPVTFDGGIGAGNMYITGGTSSPGYSRIEADFVNWSNMGSETNDEAIHWSQRNTDVNYPWYMRDCTFDNCYSICDMFANSSNNQSAGHTGKVEISRCKWINSPTPGTTPNGGNWGHLMVQGYEGMDILIDHCDFDADCRVFFCKPNGIVVTDNVWRGGITVRHVDPSNAWTAGPWKEFSRNLFLFSSTGLGLSYGEIVENNVFISTAAHNNPHFGDVQGGTGTLSMRGNIFSATNSASGSEGDGYFPRNGGSGTQADNVLSLDGNIFLPTGNGYGNDAMTATMYTFLFTNSDCKAEARHNSQYVGNMGGINLGETQATVAGCVGPTRGNIFAGRTAVSTWKISNQGQSVIDTFAPTDVANNAGFNLVAGGQAPGGGYDSSFTFTGGGPHNVGVDDVDDVDPDFVEPNRFPWKWVDPSHTHLVGLPAVADRLSLGAQGYSILDLIEWIRSGWRPRAEAYRGAGHASDGSRDLGAVPMAPAFLAHFEFEFDREEFTFYAPGLPPDMTAFVTAIEGNGTITANLVEPKIEFVGSDVRLFFDAQLTTAEEAAVISEANGLGGP